MSILPEDRFVSRSKFHVRYAETDAMRIVHHSSYIIYFEEGRSQYIRQRGEDYANFERGGLYLAVTQVEARYLKPAIYGQEITVCTWLERIQSRGMTFTYAILDGETDELLASGTTRHICIDGDGKVSKIPEHWQQWVKD